MNKIPKQYMNQEIDILQGKKLIKTMKKQYFTLRRLKNLEIEKDFTELPNAIIMVEEQNKITKKHIIFL